MTDLPSDPDTTGTASHEEVSAILAWLLAAPPASAADSLSPLHKHLDSLRSNRSPSAPHALAQERLHTRCMAVVATLTPTLTDVSLPLPRKTRQLVRSLQDLLQALAEDWLAVFDTGRDSRPRSQAICLGRSLDALAQHLLISNLTASPAGIGIWRQLHQTYDTARRLQIADNTLDGLPYRLQDVYFSALLLGCAQPASFTSSEVNFVATFLKSFAELVDLEPDTGAKFWIDPTRDEPPNASARKPLPPDSAACRFSCDRIAALLKQQLAALETGCSPAQIKLPEFAATPAGRGAMRRLIAYWGDPAKRRFPRRRQNYRAALCAGLDNLWQLFQKGEAPAIETSSWMITNVSPDGYTAMHIAGKTVSLSVGDVVALRTELGEEWQICIVRWVLSENQEHLELGLQLLATRALSAVLALPAAGDRGTCLSVLLLPKITTVSPAEMLVIPSGAVHEQFRNLVLVVENENINVREVRSTQLDERNSHIEVFSIEADPGIIA